MSLPRSFLLGGITALLAATLLGCSDPYAGKMEITGTVKLKGEPLKSASIHFDPLDGQDTVSGGGIENGQYKVPRQNGLKPGKYLVRITSGTGTNPALEEAGGPSTSNIISFDLIPPDWNTSSKQQVEVKAKGDNNFDFDIPYANTPKKKR